MAIHIIKETTSVIRSLRSWHEFGTEMERRAMDGGTGHVFHCNAGGREERMEEGSCR